MPDAVVSSRPGADHPDTLRLVDVHKSYGVGSPVETEVLHGIDLSLRPGEFAALIGPSGGGKSTMLNLMGLLDRPTSGKLYIRGQDTGVLGDADLTRLRGRAIGFVFQFHYLLPAFTAIENVMMPVLAARGRPDDEMRDNAAALLDAVGMGPWSNHMANNISGGQQQRVAVARALAMKPALVLADEPTGNLDTKTADGVFESLRKVNELSHTTFLIVTHDPRLAARCDRIIELLDGTIVSDKANAAVRG